MMKDDPYVQLATMLLLAKICNRLGIHYENEMDANITVLWKTTKQGLPFTDAISLLGLEESFNRLNTPSTHNQE
jgi:hypothetical protein